MTPSDAAENTKHQLYFVVVVYYISEGRHWLQWEVWGDINK